METIAEQLQSGLQLMVVGMGIVFLFLTLLVGAVSALPRILWRMAGEQAFEQVATVTTSAGSESLIEPDVLTAIQQAVRLYENDQ